MIRLEYIQTNLSKRVWSILGYICSILTFGLTIKYYYGFFWNREMWYTRKRLLRWLEQNKLPTHHRRGKETIQWNLDEYELSLLEDIVFVFRKQNLLLGSWRCECGPDNARYNKIMAILKKDIEAHGTK